MYVYTHYPQLKPPTTLLNTPKHLHPLTSLIFHSYQGTTLFVILRGRLLPWTVFDLQDMACLMFRRASPFPYSASLVSSEGADTPGD